MQTPKDDKTEILALYASLSEAEREFIRHEYANHAKINILESNTIALGTQKVNAKASRKHGVDLEGHVTKILGPTLEIVANYKGEQIRILLRKTPDMVGARFRVGLQVTMSVKNTAELERAIKTKSKGGEAIVVSGTSGHQPAN